MADITGAHHIALTVTDADRSAAWYCSLLGMSVAWSGEDESVRFRVLAHPGSGWVLGVRQYFGREAGPFDELRTGLDHLAFSVESREALDEWADLLAARGITFTPVADTPIGSVIVFRDPDNVQLEFWLPAS